MTREDRHDRGIKGRGAAENPPNRFQTLWYVSDEEGRDPEAPLPRTHFLRDDSKSIIAYNDSPDVGFDAGINPYRGCEHGCVYCLSGDTPILMADSSTRAIGDLRPGDEIYGTSGRGRHRRLVRTRVLDHWLVERPAFRLTLSAASALVASGEHRFLTPHGWRSVGGAGEGPGSCRRLTVNDNLVGIRKGYGPRIAAIEPLDSTLELFDITTGTGDFIANGVVSHNCYARPSHEYLGFSAGLDFETRILVKDRAPELLRRELAAPRWKPQVIALSGNTDAYQPGERRFRLTRGCLEVLAEFRNPVAVITKNHLVTRDVDLLGELARHRAALVCVSVTTLDGELARVMEPRTSHPERRLDAIRALAGAGVPVGVLVAPVVPGLTDHEVPAIVAAAAAAGARFAGYIMLRLPHGVEGLFTEWLERHFPDRRRKIEARIRDVRGGWLNDPRFRTRMRGEGRFAEQVAALFRVAVKRAGLDRRPELSTAAFRRPGYRQATLFDEA